MRRIKRLIPSPPFVAALAAVLVMGVALLPQGAVGMADNGDFYRITNGNGLYKLDRGEKDEYFDYFSLKYGVYRYYNEFGDSLPSSQTLFIKAAMALDALLTDDPDGFDIRFLGGLMIAYCAAALYLLVDYAAYGSGRWGGYAIAAAAVFLFSDTGYAAYFNSFYAEGLVMVSFLAAATCLLLLTQRRYRPVALVAGFAVNAAILTFAKQQNAPLGILSAMLLPLLIWALSKEDAFAPYKDERDVQRAPYIADRWLFLRAAYAAAGALAALGIAVYVLIPQEFVNINKYHAMTRGVLMTADDPEDALAEFGIDRQYSLLNESIHFERYPAVDLNSQMLEDGFFSKYGVADVARYYLAHPGKLWMMLNLAAGSSYSIRPQAMGNFQRQAGREPGARTAYFSLYSALKESAAPRTVGFIILWTALAIALNLRRKSRMAVIAYAIACGLSQIVVSIVGAGDADLSKHVFLYNVAFDCALFLGFSDLVNGLAGRARKRAAARVRIGTRAGGQAA